MSRVIDPQFIDRLQDAFREGDDGADGKDAEAENVRVVEAARRNSAQIEEQRPEILSVVAQGDTVVVFGRELGRFRPTGREYELHWMHLYRLGGGKVAGITELLDALRPAGR